MSIKCFLEMRRAPDIEPCCRVYTERTETIHEWRIDFRCHYPRLQLTDRSEIRVADYILKHKPELPYIMSKTLADACQVSEATITRFCRSVGCASFNDFKVRAAQAISSDSTSGPASGYDLYGDIQLEDSLEQKCQKLYRVGTQALQQTLDLLDYGAVRKVVDCLYEADNVYCFGQGNTSIIAMDAWGRFSSITSKFHWINDFHMQAITAATLGAKDVILYFSFSGAMRELSELGASSRRRRPS